MAYCCQKKLFLLALPSQVECPWQGMCTLSLSFLFRKDHLSSPPVPYEQLQKLLEAVLKRCADLSPPQSSKSHAVSQKLSFAGRTKADREDPPSTLYGCCI